MVLVCESIFFLGNFSIFCQVNIDSLCDINTQLTVPTSLSNHYVYTGSIHMRGELPPDDDPFSVTIDTKVIDRYFYFILFYFFFIILEYFFILFYVNFFIIFCYFILFLFILLLLFIILLIFHYLILVCKLTNYLRVYTKKST